MKDTNKKKSNINRRNFLQTSSILAAGTVIAPSLSFGAPAILKNWAKPNSYINGVQIGVITYSFRSMESDAESILTYCVESGINAIELMGYTAEAFAGIPSNPNPRRRGRRRREEDMTPEQKRELAELKKAQAAYAKEIADWRAAASMDKFAQLRRMYEDAGVSIYAWKPNALGVGNTDGEVDYALRVAKVLGASHVTVEIPKDSAQSLRLGQLAKKHKVSIGYHGHLQQTFTAWDEAISQSKYNALNCDIGHYVAAGFDPLPLLKAKRKKIKSIHLKDRKSKENGQKNMPWGEGDTPIAEALQLMKGKKYKFPGTIELEYEIPAGSDAVQEVGKCLEYCRSALS